MKDLTLPPASRSRLDEVLSALILARRTAMLATLDDDGRPCASLVPYAVDARAGGLVVRISALSAHTRHLRTRPAASLLIAEGEDGAAQVHALSRVSIEVTARFEPEGGDGAVRAAACYLARHPDAQVLAELPDFAWVTLQVGAARQIAGFGAARGVEATRMRELLRPA